MPPKKQKPDLDRWQEAAGRAWSLPQGNRRLITEFMGLTRERAERLQGIRSRIAAHQEQLANAEENPPGSLGYNIEMAQLAQEEKDYEELQYKSGSDEYEFFWKHAPGQPPPPPPGVA